MPRKTIPAEERAIRKVISLPPDICKKLEKISECTGIPQSHLVQAMIAEYDEAKELRARV